MRNLRSTVFAFSVAVSMSALAQTGSQTAVEDTDPVFHVELIVFAYNSSDRNEEDFRHGFDTALIGPAPELFRLPPIELESPVDFVSRLEPDAEPEEPLAPQERDSIPRLDNAELEPELPADGLEPIERVSGRAPIGSERGNALPGRFRPLSRSELQLGDARARLNRLGAYTVLGHVGWAQTGVDTDRSVALDVSRLGIMNPVGTIEVYLRRFLHVALDLEYFDGNGTLWSAGSVPGLSPFEYAESYRLATERNAMRSDELHFIDHPLFGVLVRITRAPEVEEDEVSLAVGRGPAG